MFSTTIISLVCQNAALCGNGLKLCFRNDWEKFCPYTNVLWLHYLADKLVYSTTAAIQSKQDKDTLRKFRKFLSEMLDYGSAAEMTLDSSFLNSWWSCFISLCAKWIFFFSVANCLIQSVIFSPLSRFFYFWREKLQTCPSLGGSAHYPDWQKGSCVTWW